MPSKTGMFWILIAASAVSAFVLPSRWTAPLRRLFQPLALLQWPVSRAVTTGDGARGELAPGSMSREEALELAERLRRENEELRDQLANQAGLLLSERQRVADLSGLTDQLADTHVQIVIAPVVSRDANPRRATLQIVLSQRQRALVREGGWVAAGRRPMAADRQTGGRELLHRQWLIGRVSEVQTRVARVQLTTDPNFQNEVRLARLDADGALLLAEEGCVLEGRGHGRMRISRATRDHFTDGYRIVLAPASEMLPTPLILGRVVGSERRKDSAQHFDLQVAPWGETERLSHVYVVSTGP